MDTAFALCRQNQTKARSTSSSKAVDQRTCAAVHHSMRSQPTRLPMRYQSAVPNSDPVVPTRTARTM